MKETDCNMKLFVIEGIDGAGKSTQITLLKDYLSSRGYITEFMHFPRTGAPYFGELIARFLRGEFGSLKEVDPYLVAMLYAGDRKDAAEEIRNWIKQGKIVILDRYTYSNIAYQCAKLNAEQAQDDLLKWILNLEFSHFAIPRPDLNVFLDVPLAFTEKKLSNARTGDDRSYLKGMKDIHEESMEFQRKVRDIYLKVSKNDELLEVVDCSTNGEMLPPNRIFEMILNLLNKKNLI
jgi:dTMP kinase